MARLLVIASLIVTATGVGCELDMTEWQDQRPQGEQPPSEGVAEVTQEADQKRATPRVDVADGTDPLPEHYAQAITSGKQKLEAARDHLSQEVKAATAEAEEKIGAINGQKVAMNAEFQAWSQGVIGDLDHRIDRAKAKAMAARDETREAFEAEMKDVDDKRDELADEIAATPARLEAFDDKIKEGFTARAEKLKERVSRLSKQR